MSGWGAIYESPGIVELTRETESLTFDIGMVENHNQEALETIAPIQGKDVVKLFDYSGSIKKKFSLTTSPLQCESIKHSMLQDIEKGKPSEVDPINGVLGEQARKAGVPTPANERVIDLIHRIETKGLQAEMKNLELFE